MHLKQTSRIKPAFQFALIFVVFGVLGHPGGKAAASVKNPYAQIDWNRVNQYKANFHCHTTNSDGRGLPSKMIEIYAEAGYHILAITDHDRHHRTRPGEPETIETPEATWPWTDYIEQQPSTIWTHDGMETSAFFPSLGPDGMLAIRGNELTEHPHIVSLFNNCGWLERLNDETRLGCVQAQGGLSYYAHPTDYILGGRWEGIRFEPDWESAVDYYGGYITGHSSCLGIEMQLGDRRVNEEKLFDKLLQRYYRDHDIFVYGGDDNHQPRVRNDATLTIVLAEELTGKAIRNAMVSGHVFVGQRTETYPRFKGIEVDEEEKRIVLTIEDYDKVVWIKNGQNFREGKSISFAEMSDTVLRFEVEADGVTFYSQAFYIK